MKSYVITIMQEERSVGSAKRCINSMPEHNVQMFHAFTPKDKPQKLLEAKWIETRFFQDETYSYKQNCMAAFLSHYTLWEQCVSDNEEYQIFEHDAIAINTVPEFIPNNGCISLGAPSYGRFVQPEGFGAIPLRSKEYFPGAHAYRVTPKGARQLLEVASTQAGPTDVFLALDRFPWLQEYYPWPVVADDSFTTIQRRTGCLAKHNWNSEFGIYRVN